MFSLQVPVMCGVNHPKCKETALGSDYVEPHFFFVISSVHFVVVGQMTSWVTAWTSFAIQLEQGKTDSDLLLHGISTSARGNSEIELHSTLG
jgi:hypothetical protein